MTFYNTNTSCRLGKTHFLPPKIYIFPCWGWQLSCDSSSGWVFVPISTSHTSLRACPRIQSWGSHSPILGEATAPSLLNPCHFQGSCLTFHDASFHLLRCSSPVLTEGNQSEIQLSRLISIVKGCGEYAIIQRGCLTAPCATGEENQSIKCMHQRDSSQGPLISLYRVCLEKIREDSCPNSGTKVRPQLTPAPTPSRAHQSCISWAKLMEAARPMAPCTNTPPCRVHRGGKISAVYSVQWCKSRITSPAVTHSPLYVPDLMARKALQMLRYLKLGKDFNLWSSWVHP